MTTSKNQAGVAAFLLVLVALLGSGFTDKGQSGGAQAETKVYLGFDRNEYPGDAALPVLRKSFSFAGYWLTPPPRTLQNSCVGKRKILKEQGLGFLLLARGRSASTTQSDPTENGIADAREAVRNAQQEGFVTGSVVFLDIEEGGRLPPQFHAYLRFGSMNWNATDLDRGFTVMSVNDGNNRTIVTSDDVRSNMGKRDIVFWVLNDTCPPSRGCTSAGLPGPTKSGVEYAAVWQFVRSPRSKETALPCKGYANDENCYVALDTAHRWRLDLDVATSKILPHLGEGRRRAESRFVGLPEKFLLVRAAA